MTAIESTQPDLCPAAIDASSIERPRPAEPRTLARRAGLLYLVPMILGPFSMMYVPSVVVVPSDASATAERLAQSESLVRLGLASDMAIVLAELALTALLYVLLRPAGRTLALTASFARLAMTTVQAVNLVPALVALHLVGSDTYAIDTTALASIALHARDQGVHVWEILFALHCLAVGVSILRSSYFPRVLGALMVLAALGYATNGLGHLLVPSGAAVFEVIVAVAAIVGEVPFALWLLVKGVDAERWHARAAA